MEIMWEEATTTIIILLEISAGDQVQIGKKVVTLINYLIKNKNSPQL